MVAGVKFFLASLGISRDTHQICVVRSGKVREKCAEMSGKVREFKSNWLVHGNPVRPSCLQSCRGESAHRQTPKQADWGSDTTKSFTDTLVQVINNTSNYHAFRYQGITLRGYKCPWPQRIGVWMCSLGGGQSQSRLNACTSLCLIITHRYAIRWYSFHLFKQMLAESTTLGLEPTTFRSWRASELWVQML